jgi:predicted ATPase/DNA-binding CsgD family transcriptional regulator
MNLPAPLTSIVGREQELAELQQLLGRARLVTLTGAGGVGKTRLALAVAEELGETFADGVIFVDLASVIHVEQVTPTIARALGIRDDGEAPIVERLANALRDRELLLILDNFEQVLPAAHDVLELLRDSPYVTALVTSRAALRIRGEREFPVAPLACPDSGGFHSLDSLLHYPALDLFVRCAQDVRPDFALAPANAVAVIEVCRRLDGLPLALELAAARVRVLSPQAMLDRLGQALALLTDGPRDLPARQQTLRATIAWSHELLSPAEQALFRRLAVFPGDFGLDAASAVSASALVTVNEVDGIDFTSVALQLVTSLVEKNLLRREEGPESEPRFRMLETVREFALEQLKAFGEEDATRRAHAAFFVSFVEEAAPHLRRSERELWLRRVDVEMDNLRSVVAWSSSVDRGAALRRIVLGLSFLYWRIRGHLHDGLRWAELALETVEEPASTERARLLWVAGALAGYMERFVPAREWLEQCVNLARTSGDDGLLGDALIFLGWAECHLGEDAAAMHVAQALAILREMGDLDDLLLAMNVAIVPFIILDDFTSAHATLDECLTLARELGDEWAIAVALNNAAYLDLSERNWALARVHLEQSLAILNRFDDEGSIAIIYNNLAVAARQLGDDDRTVSLFEQSLDLQRRLGLNAATTLYNLGDLALRHDEILQAISYLEEALRESLRGGELRAIVAGLVGLARLALAVSRPEIAARLLGGAAALRERAGTDFSEHFEHELERATDAARASLGEEAFRAALADGETTPLERLTTEALEWVEALPAQTDRETPALRQAASSQTSDHLSPREIEVLQLIASGKSNQEVAAALVISTNTVARHVSNIFDKTGAANRTEAAAYAYRHGIAH